MKSIRVLISGAVQGVFFRRHIEEQAKKIGVNGFVRNLEDGRVEVVIEGTEDKVKKMLDVCKQGTSNAIVRNVEVNEIKYNGFKDFRIIRI